MTLSTDPEGFLLITEEPFSGYLKRFADRLRKSSRADAEKVAEPSTAGASKIRGRSASFIAIDDPLAESDSEPAVDDLAASLSAVANGLLPGREVTITVKRGPQ